MKLRIKIEIILVCIILILILPHWNKSPSIGNLLLLEIIAAFGLNIYDNLKK